MLNLAANALKFTRERIRRASVWRSADDEIVLRVTDTGVGIPESEVAQVFDRFHRVSRTAVDAVSKAPGSASRSSPRRRARWAGP